jgi:hypothetical protein
MLGGGSTAGEWWGGGSTAGEWETARQIVETAPATYWLATVRPDGRPHVMPILSVWVNGMLFWWRPADGGKAVGRGLLTTDLTRRL